MLFNIHNTVVSNIPKVQIKINELAVENQVDAYRIWRAYQNRIRAADSGGKRLLIKKYIATGTNIICKHQELAKKSASVGANIHFSQVFLIRCAICMVSHLARFGLNEPI